MNASKRTVVVGRSALLAAIAVCHRDRNRQPAGQGGVPLQRWRCAGIERPAQHQQPSRGQSTAKIIVVAHARGVDFLMKGAKDTNGNKFEDLVEQLTVRGCNSTCARSPCVIASWTGSSSLQT